MEQTFNDLCREKMQAKQPLFGFVLWMFIETAAGIFKEYLSLMTSGAIMKTLLKILGSPAPVSLLLIFPFIVMEIVNRRNFNEGFPFALFFALWFDLFAVSLILLPIVRAVRPGENDLDASSPAKGGALLLTPKSVLIAGVVVTLFLAIISVLSSAGWGLLDHPLNGSNSEIFSFQVPSQLIAFALFLLPIALGMSAASPIVKTLKAGGSLFAHPFLLIIVIMISFFFTVSFFNLIVDQWSCFAGIPNCD